MAGTDGEAREAMSSEATSKDTPREDNDADGRDSNRVDTEGEASRGFSSTVAGLAIAFRAERKASTFASRFFLSLVGRRDF
jgi:hypothetical protein